MQGSYPKSCACLHALVKSFFKATQIVFQKLLSDVREIQNNGCPMNGLLWFIALTFLGLPSSYSDTILIAWKWSTAAPDGFDIDKPFLIIEQVRCLASQH